MASNAIMQGDGWVVVENDTYIEGTLPCGGKIRFELTETEITNGDAKPKFLPRHVEVYLENQVAEDMRHWVLIAQLPCASLEVVAAMCVHAGFKWTGGRGL